MGTENNTADDRSSGGPWPLTPDSMLAGWSGAEVEEFMRSCDRLVRHLFDVGLRLHTLRGGRPGTALDAELSSVLDELDILIRDSAIAMLTLARASGNTNHHHGRPTRRRRR
ncbi:hypothetical protein [Nocardia thraciensis]